MTERSDPDLGAPGEEASRRYGRWESDGPPLWLLHGAGGNHLVWRPLLSPLSTFDLVAPSLPGRLGSGGRAPSDAAEAAAYVGGLMDEIGAPPAFVLGHSYGGAVAIELALRSERVAGLILVCSGARLRVHPTILQAAEQAVATGGTVPTRFAFGGAADPAAIEAYEEAMAATDPRAALADWRACDRFDRMADLDRVEAPTLVVAGADDALTPTKYQRYLADHLPRAQLERVDGCGHMLPWERPALLGRLVRTWAAAVGSR